MTDSEPPARACYPMSLIRPFVEVLRPYPVFGPVLESLTAQDSEARIPIEVAHKFLGAAIEVTGDIHLGLRASRELGLGDLGAIDYLTGSVATVREAIEIASNYAPIFNEALSIHLDVRAGRARLRFDNSILMPRAAADFQLAGFYRVHVRSWWDEGLASLEVLLTNPAPDDTAEYETTFAPAQLRFGMPFSGFAFDAELLQRPLPRADPKLQRVIRRQVESALSALPRNQTFTQQVRDVAAVELTAGKASAAYVAKKLGVSQRTLTRKLEREGTTYTELLEDLRKSMALRYLESRDLQLSEVALRLGFSQAASFHRAFRRWTGRTPRQYRRRQLR
jgi:AraC-like DNA-binding protein